MRLPGSDVRARQSFVDRETVYRLMESSPPSYRLMIALCRFQGLRAPSEVCSLKWDMVHFERNEITIPSPKTEHHPGGSRRIMPLCPDMRAILLDTLNREGEGDGFVVGREFYDRAKTSRRYGWQAINLNTHLRRLIEKAGLEPWPRAWHNLRSSLETELMRHFPVPQVAAWLGHNPQIALRHYNQTSGEANRLAYDRLSAGIHLEEAEKSDSKSGASYPSTIPQLTQKASHHLSAANNTESQTVSVRDDGIVTYAESCDELPNGTGVHSVHKLDATGLEPVTTSV
ncbi:MAG: site-specific integrase [Planctomycetia bacterium]|nr:site-specific integrase [Planctomycetia bacterium]